MTFISTVGIYYKFIVPYHQLFREPVGNGDGGQ